MGNHHYLLSHSNYLVVHTNLVIFLLYAYNVPAEVLHGTYSKLRVAKQLIMPDKSLPFILIILVHDDASLQSENKDVCET